MIEVHLIGYTSDLRHLVLDLDAGNESGRYRLVVDADLFLTVDELRDLRRRTGMDPGVPYAPDPVRVEGYPDVTPPVPHEESDGHPPPPVEHEPELAPPPSATEESESARPMPTDEPESEPASRGDDEVTIDARDDREEAEATDPDDVSDEAAVDVSTDVSAAIPDDILEEAPEVAPDTSDPADATDADAADADAADADAKDADTADADTADPADADTADDTADDVADAASAPDDTSDARSERRAARRQRPSAQVQTVRVLGSDEVADALSRQLEELRRVPPPEEPPRRSSRREAGGDADLPVGPADPSTRSGTTDERERTDERARQEEAISEDDRSRHRLIDAAALLDLDEPQADEHGIDPDAPEGHGPANDADGGDRTEDEHHTEGEDDSVDEESGEAAAGEDAAVDDDVAAAEDSDEPSAEPVEQAAPAFSSNGSAPADPRASRRDMPDSDLSPAEIQSHLRAGRSAAWVAKQAGTDIEWIERWLPPILAERRQVLEEAHGMRVEADEQLAADALVDTVSRRLDERDVDTEDATWRVKRRSDGRWSVNLQFEENGRSRSATWALDRERGRLRPSSDLARDLGWTPARR